MSEQIRASESDYVQKARLKMESQLKKNDQKITPQALKASAEGIRRHIQEHAEERKTLKDKSVVALFDGNAHSAGVHSIFVRNLQQKLAH